MVYKVPVPTHGIRRYYYSANYYRTKEKAMASSHAARKRPRNIGGGRGALSDDRHAADGWVRRFATPWSDSAARAMLREVEGKAAADASDRAQRGDATQLVDLV